MLRSATSPRRDTAEQPAQISLFQPDAQVVRAFARKDNDVRPLHQLLHRRSGSGKALAPLYVLQYLAIR